MEHVYKVRTLSPAYRAEFLTYSLSAAPNLRFNEVEMLLISLHPHLIHCRIVAIFNVSVSDYCA